MSRSYAFAVAAAAAIFLIPAVAGAQYRTSPDYSALFDSETVQAFRKHVGFLSSASLEGRAPGSDGEKEAAEYVYDRLEDYGVEMLSPREGDLFGISGNGGDTLVSRNVVGFIQGYDRNLRNSYVVVGARLDNLGVNTMTVDGKEVTQIYYGANGNASGLAMMLELARMVSTNSIMFRRSVIFVAFGASTRSYAGAWYFLNRSFSDAASVDAMINLDMLGTGDNGFYAYSASNSDLNYIVSSLEGTMQPVQPEIVASEPYPSDHRAFYSSGIPSLMLTSGKYPEHNTHKDTGSIIDYDYMERELEYVYSLTMEIANTDRPLDFQPAESQKRQTVTDDDVVSYNDCDIRPMFLNSADPRQFMEKWVYQYLKYPERAVIDGIQGRVLVNFIIERDGKVTNVTVARGVDPLLDDEAVRIISASPKWKPGRVNGEKVRTSMTIPVEFRLERKSDRKSFGIRR